MAARLVKTLCGVGGCFLLGCGRCLHVASESLPLEVILALRRYGWRGIHRGQPNHTGQGLRLHVGGQELVPEVLDTRLERLGCDCLRSESARGSLRPSVLWVHGLMAKGTETLSIFNHLLRV